MATGVSGGQRGEAAGGGGGPLRALPPPGGDTGTLPGPIALRFRPEFSTAEPLSPAFAPASFSSREGFRSHLLSLASPPALRATLCRAVRGSRAGPRRWTADLSCASLSAAATAWRTRSSPALPDARLPCTVGADGTGPAFGNRPVPSPGRRAIIRLTGGKTSGFHPSTETVSTW